MQVWTIEPFTCTIGKRHAFLFKNAIHVLFHPFFSFRHHLKFAKKIETLCLSYKLM